MTNPEIELEISKLHMLCAHVQRLSTFTRDLESIAALIEASARLDRRAQQILQDQAKRFAKTSPQR